MSACFEGRDQAQVIQAADCPVPALLGEIMRELHEFGFDPANDIRIVYHVLFFSSLFDLLGVCRSSSRGDFARDDHQSSTSHAYDDGDPHPVGRRGAQDAA